MRIRNFFITAAMFGLSLGFFSSCTDVLDSSADEVLLDNEVYRNKDDADAAIRGIYGQLMDVAAQYVVLNELRADLMDVTQNADLSLIEIAQHLAASKGNKWADPRQFFSLINNCNDVAANLTIMTKTTASRANILHALFRCYCRTCGLTFRYRSILHIRKKVAYLILPSLWPMWPASASRNSTSSLILSYRS